MVGGFLTDLAAFVSIPGSHGGLGQLVWQAHGDRLNPSGDPFANSGKYFRIVEVPGVRLLFGHERERTELIRSVSNFVRRYRDLDQMLTRRQMRMF